MNADQYVTVAVSFIGAGALLLSQVIAGRSAARRELIAEDGWAQRERDLEGERSATAMRADVLERRRECYLAALKSLHELLRWMGETRPIMTSGDHLDPPMPGVEARMHVQALIDLYGSKKVRDLFGQFAEELRQFVHGVMEFELDGDRADPKLYLILENHRKRADELLGEIRTVMAREVQGESFDGRFRRFSKRSSDHLETGPTKAASNDLNRVSKVSDEVEKQ